MTAPNIAHEAFQKDLWHKVVAFLMHRHGLTDELFTLGDIDAFPKGKAVVLSSEDEGRALRLRFVTELEAERLIADRKREGGEAGRVL